MLYNKIPTGKVTYSYTMVKKWLSEDELKIWLITFPPIKHLWYKRKTLFIKCKFVFK